MFHSGVFGVSAYMTHLLAVHFKLPFWAATLPRRPRRRPRARRLAPSASSSGSKTFYFAVVTLA